jgi:pSer/pThr/pTyr-binding forkhead associated (FHA) protein
VVNGGAPFQITSDVINIGRMIDNDLAIDDPYVSRYHIQLRRRGSEYLLFDINSSRGTLVNGVRVREHALRSGDVIDIGRSRLIYMDDRAEDSASPPTETFEGV